MSTDASEKKHKTPGRITAFLDRLSTSNLMFVVAATFLIDLFIPDAIPFIDEMVLGVLTILLARWRSGALRRTAEAAAESAPSSTGSQGYGSKPPPKNVTPDR